MTIEFPFIEKHVNLINEDHIVDTETDIAIYAIGRNSGEGSDRFSESGDKLFLLDECHFQYVINEDINIQIYIKSC